MAKQKYYVVWMGKEPGVYKTWRECERQIINFDGAKYKSFYDEELAGKAFKEGYKNYIGKDFGKLTEKEKIPYGKPIQDSICVDAACSGNPGIMEYQGVFTETETHVFHQGPFPEATVNIGEFLALVHALAYLKQHKLDMPIYTDSLTAMAWVRKKRANTKLRPNDINKKVFELMDRAIYWLHNNTYQTVILKWNTKVWGEIPADFGRK